MGVDFVFLEPSVVVVCWFFMVLPTCLVQNFW